MKLPKGFRSGAVSAVLKSSGALDLTIIQNEGPDFVCAAIFTSNKVVAAPVTWTKQVVADGIVSAVLLNSGGENACTGARGFSDTHKSAEHVAKKLGISAADVAVCSTGLIGEFLPMEKILLGIGAITSLLSQDNLEATARAIMTTDSVPKIASSEKYGVMTVGIAKGAGMLAPSLATMLSVVMTDAVVPVTHLQEIFTRVCDRTFKDDTSCGRSPQLRHIAAYVTSHDGTYPSYRRRHQQHQQRRQRQQQQRQDQWYRMKQEHQQRHRSS